MIIPAILEKTTQGITQKLEKITELGKKVTRVQIDFCDGVFVPAESLLVTELPELPDDFEWEAHIMHNRPTNFAEYKSAGFTRIVVHYEAFESEEELEEALHKIAELELIPDLAINPDTTVSVIRYFTDTISNFTIMSVNPGMQGQSFIDETINRVKELREMAPDATIEVDGGINSENAASIIEAGANNLAVGSALFETEDIKANYKKLNDRIA